MSSHEVNGAFVIFRNDAGEIFLERDNRKPSKLTLPGGGIGFGELPNDSVAREVHEELGVIISRNNLRLVGCFTRRLAYGDVWLFEYFGTRKLVVEEIEYDEREVSAVTWLKPEEILKMTDDEIYSAQRSLVMHYLNWKDSENDQLVIDFLSPPFLTCRS